MPNDKVTLEEIKELILAQEEYRQLGHRIVWDESGECNVPGMRSLRGPEIEKQLARQKKYYR